MGVARRDVVYVASRVIYGRNQCRWQLVVHELIFEERGDPLGEAQAPADGEVPAPRDDRDGFWGSVGLTDHAVLVGVIADGSVEAAACLKGPTAIVKESVVPASGLSAVTILARG